MRSKQLLKVIKAPYQTNDEEQCMNPEDPEDYKDERFKHVASSYPGLIISEDFDQTPE